MFELMMKYSGITAIIVYSILLYLLLKLTARKRKPEEKQLEPAQTERAPQASPLDLQDEDATVAALIASIECHSETGKNVRVVSVREI